MPDKELVALLRQRLRLIAKEDASTRFGMISLRACLTSLPDDLIAYPHAAVLSQQLRALAQQEQLAPEELQVRLRQLVQAALDRLLSPPGESGSPA